MKETSEDSSNLSRADFMSSFLDRHRPPDEALEHFAATEWTNHYLQDSAYKIVPTFSRHLKSNGEDYYFSKTINTESTVPHMVSLMLKDFQTLGDNALHPAEAQIEGRSTKSPVPAPDTPDLVILVQVGKQGLDGHPSLIHGGVTCAILDETMGLLLMLHHNNLHGPGPRDSLFTANLNVSYRAPIPTPAQYIVKTWLTKREGRKWYSRGHIVDRDGKVLADAEGLWLIARSDKL